MDIWDPSFCEFLSIPIPEDVVSLVFENEARQTQQVSGMHGAVEYCQPQSLKNPVQVSGLPLKLLQMCQVLWAVGKKSTMRSRPNQHAFLGC